MALLNYIAAHPLSVDGILSVTLAPLLSVSLRDLPAPLVPASLAAALLAAEIYASLALGLRVIAWFCPAMASRAERVFFSFLAGLGVMSLIHLGAGLAGFFRAECFILTFGFAAICFKDPWTETRMLFAEAKPGKLPAWALLGLFAVVIIQLGSLVSGYVPPHISDEQTYHLGTAKYYLELGKVAFWPSNVYTFHPQMDTMLYAPYLSAGLLYGIKWLHWAAGMLGAWGLWLMLQKVSRPVRIGALLLYLSIPAVWIVGGWAFNDLLIVAYGVGAILAAERSRGFAGRRALLYALLAGSCVGFAASNKYTGLLLGLALLPFLGFPKLLAAAAAAAAVFSPWMIKNWIWFGNPLFPYFWRILGGLGWDEILAWRYKKKLLQADATLAEKLFELPGLPWKMPIRNFGSGNQSNAGPLIVPAIPLLFLGSGAFEMLGLAALIALFSITAFGSLGTRFMIPILPLMIFFAARRLSSMDAPRRGRGLVAAGFVLLLFYQAFDIYQTSWKEYDDPLRLVFAREKLPKYLDRMLYPHIYYPYSYSLMLDAVEKRTPPEAKILFLGGYGGAFYIPRRTIFAPLLGRPLPLIFSREVSSLPEMRKKFRQMGITHVLTNCRHTDIFYDYWKVWDWGDETNLIRWRDFWDGYAAPVWKFQGHFTLHRLSDAPLVQPHQTTPGLEDEVLRLLRTVIGKKEYAHAAAMLKWMARLFPNNPSTWLRAGQYFMATGKIPEAKNCCEEIRKRAPASDEMLRCQAMLLSEQKRYAEAIRLLEDVAVGEALDPQIWADLYILHEARGDKERAAIARIQYMQLREFRPYR